jgi:hypothetical protein
MYDDHPSRHGPAADRVAAVNANGLGCSSVCRLPPRPASAQKQTPSAGASSGIPLGDREYREGDVSLLHVALPFDARFPG